MRTTDAMIVRNKKTGKTEAIVQRNIEFTDWGFTFRCSSELDAYKAAYQYRNSPHGTEVQFAEGVQEWMVTVFNKNICPGTSR